MGKKTQGWHPADVKAALEKAGWNFSKISLQIMGHRDKRTSYRVLRHPYPVMEKVVGELLGVHPAEIWPDRYKADGTPSGSGIRRKNIKFPTLGKDKNAAVA